MKLAVHQGEQLAGAGRRIDGVLRGMDAGEIHPAMVPRALSEPQQEFTKTKGADSLEAASAGALLLIDLGRFAAEPAPGVINAGVERWSS